MFTNTTNVSTIKYDPKQLSRIRIASEHKPYHIYETIDECVSETNPKSLIYENAKKFQNSKNFADDTGCLFYNVSPINPFLHNSYESVKSENGCRVSNSNLFQKEFTSERCLKNKFNEYVNYRSLQNHKCDLYLSSNKWI